MDTTSLDPLKTELELETALQHASNKRLPVRTEALESKNRQRK